MTFTATVTVAVCPLPQLNDKLMAPLDPPSHQTRSTACRVALCESRLSDLRLLSGTSSFWVSCAKSARQGPGVQPTSRRGTASQLQRSHKRQAQNPPSACSTLLRSLSITLEWRNQAMEWRHLSLLLRAKQTLNHESLTLTYEISMANSRHLTGPGARTGMS